GLSGWARPRPARGGAAARAVRRSRWAVAVGGTPAARLDGRHAALALPARRGAACGARLGAVPAPSLERRRRRLRAALACPRAGHAPPAPVARRRAAARRPSPPPAPRPRAARLA